MLAIQTHVLRRLVRGAVLISLFVCASLWQHAHALEKPPQRVSLALQWLVQCQFAGYFAALEQGFYRWEGIDLTIIPGASDINPIDLVSSGAADFGTKWLADFMAAKDNGLPLISIAQVLQHNGLVLIAKAKTGIRTPRDFIGKNLGIWFFGNEIQFFALMNKLSIPLDRMRIDALKWSIEPFLNDQFDVVMAMVYNEYLRALDSGYLKKDINVIDFAEYGLNFPGQVIFTHNATLQNNPDLCARMVRASLQGWQWAIDHPAKAVDIVMKYDQTKSLNRDLQLKQINAVIELVKYGNRPLGYHQPEQVAFVLSSLLEHRVLSQKLELADIYTNSIWEQAHRH